MSERDILIERLERKLVEKEREVVELRKMLSDNFERIKEDILFQIKKDLAEIDVQRKLTELESKVLELKRAVESIVNEITYIKGELREIRERAEHDTKRDTDVIKRDVPKITEREEAKETKEADESQKKLELDEEEEENLIICD